MSYILKLIYLPITLLLCCCTYSQTDTVKLKLIETLTQFIKRNYVSSNVAKQMSDTISYKFKNNKYDSTLNLDEFAFEITADLRRISKDEHISVTRPVYKPFDEYDFAIEVDKMTNKQRKKYFEKIKKDSKKIENDYKKRTSDDMFTYGEIKILPGKIGYVEIKDFQTTSYDKKKNRARISIEKVMKFLRNTNSIIIDFRENQGGSIKQAAKFCSYFSAGFNQYFITKQWFARYDSSGIEKELTNISKMYTSDRIDNTLTKSKKIYILTSKRTFSAAELSTYKIKQLNPDTKIIGEKTYGGGNGHSGTETQKYFSAIIPSLKTFDEENGNYTIETKGIIPDILTSADSSLNVAFHLARKGEIDSNTYRKTKFFKKETSISPQNKNHFPNHYQDYLGNYRKVKIIKQDDNVYMIYDSYIKIPLIPKATDYFIAENLICVKFLRNNKNQVIAIQIKHTDEFSEEFRQQ